METRAPRGNAQKKTPPAEADEVPETLPTEADEVPETLPTEADEVPIQL